MQVEMPFAVDRASGQTLIQQVANGLKEAIVCGSYLSGSVLPTTREMAHALGVGRVVVERALAKLKMEGFICPRPRVGSVVLPLGTKHWNGHVLLVVTDHAGSYYSNVFVDEVKSRLADAGYQCTQIVADSFLPGGVNVGVLESVLKRSVDFVLVLFSSPVVERCISESGIPFVVVGAKPCRRRHCLGRLVLDWNAAVPDFIRECRLHRIETVLQVRTRKVATVDAKHALVSAGIRCSELIVAESEDDLRPYGTQQKSFCLFAQWLKCHQRRLPDLIFFADDAPTVGALWAMADQCVLAPEDVRIVSWANKGNDPLYRRNLTKMTMNPRVHGGMAAKFALSCLLGADKPIGLTIGPVYEDGETFP